MAQNERAAPPLKVSIVIPTLVGGAFTNLGASLVGGMRELGADAGLVVIYSPTPSHLTKFSDIPIHSLRAKRTLTAVPALTKYLRDKRPDVLITMPQMVNFLGVSATCIARTETKLLISEHSNLSFDMALPRKKGSMIGLGMRTAKYVYRFADALVSPSQGILDDPAMADCLARTRFPVAVIPNPLPWHELPRSPEMGGELHPWLSTRDHFLFLSVGRLGEQKGFDVLLLALKQLIAAGLPARLLVLGEGPLRQDLLDQRVALGLEEHVQLLGFRSDVAMFMQHSDAFVLASRWEGFGIVLIEALACGLPIVSTDAPGGPREILEHERNALKVPVDSPSDLAAAMARVMVNNELRTTLSANGIKDAELYRPSAIARQYLEFIRTMVG